MEVKNMSSALKILVGIIIQQKRQLFAGTTVREANFMSFKMLLWKLNGLPGTEGHGLVSAERAQKPQLFRAFGAFLEANAGVVERSPWLCTCSQSFLPYLLSHSITFHVFWFPIAVHRMKSVHTQYGVSSCICYLLYQKLPQNIVTSNSKLFILVWWSAIWEWLN